MSSTVTTSTSPGDAHHVPRQRRVRVFNRITRVVLALSFAAAAAGAAIYEHDGRQFEAYGLSWLLGALGLMDDARVSESALQPAVAFAHGDEWFALRITAQCAIAFYVAAVLLLSAILALLPRIRVSRLLLATGIGAVGMVALNQVRLLVIAFAFSRGGRDAFNWAHGPLGSVIMLTGIAATLVLFFFLCLRTKQRSVRR